MSKLHKILHATIYQFLRAAFYLAFAFMICFVLLVVGVIILIGPYTTWYNHECKRLANEAELIGRPEADIVSVLGPPSYVSDSYRGKAYNYAPCLSFGEFQVQCEDGIVTGIELFDD